MAAPNLIGATTITGKTAAVSLANTSTFVVVTNASGSGKCLKINTLNVANYGNAAANVTVSYYSAAAAGGTGFPIVGSVVVPAQSTLNVIDRSSQYYVEEDRSVGASSTVGNTVSVTVSYEDIV